MGVIRLELWDVEEAVRDGEALKGRNLEDGDFICWSV